MKVCAGFVPNDDSSASVDSASEEQAVDRTGRTVLSTRYLPAPGVAIGSSDHSSDDRLLRTGNPAVHETLGRLVIQVTFLFHYIKNDECYLLLLPPIKVVMFSHLSSLCTCPPSASGSVDPHGATHVGGDTQQPI